MQWSCWSPPPWLWHLPQRARRTAPKADCSRIYSLGGLRESLASKGRSVRPRRFVRRPLVGRLVVAIGGLLVGGRGRRLGLVDLNLDLALALFFAFFARLSV